MGFLIVYLTILNYIRFNIMFTDLILSIAKTVLNLSMILFACSMLNIFYLFIMMMICVSNDAITCTCMCYLTCIYYFTMILYIYCL